MSVIHVNYITEKAELEEVFRLVNNYLDPQGIFIFDFNTEYKYREILGNQVIAEDREECALSGKTIMIIHQ